MPEITRTDNLNVADRRRTMQRVRSQDTKPELFVRRLLHSLGYRYRLRCADLPGKPDIVFTKRRKVIFVHGCFWHGHNCKAGNKQPKTNSGYWLSKLAKNRLRDSVHQAQLRENQWQVLVVWECEVKNPDALRTRLLAFLEDMS